MMGRHGLLPWTPRWRYGWWSLGAVLVDQWRRRSRCRGRRRKIMNRPKGVGNGLLDGKHRHKVGLSARANIEREP